MADRFVRVLLKTVSSRRSITSIRRRGGKYALSNAGLAQLAAAGTVKNIRYGVATDVSRTMCSSSLVPRYLVSGLTGRFLRYGVCNNHIRFADQSCQSYSHHFKFRTVQLFTCLGCNTSQHIRFLHTTPAKLWYGHLTVSPEQVSSILHRNEVSVRVDDGKGLPVKAFMTNQIASNNPLEDRRAEADCVLTKAMLFGVFDGHHGPACAQVVSERLFNYIAAEILPYDVLQQAHRMFTSGDLLELVDWYQHPNDYVSRDRQLLFRQSLGQYLRDNLAIDYQGEDSMPDILMTSFDRLDKDLSTEALRTSSGEFDDEGLHTVFSGACACVAYVEADNVYVASAGDCRAVLGRQMENDAWSAIALSNDHNAQNAEEVKRLRSTHPLDESSTVIKNGRLLSELAPLRAFGDVRYKWSRSVQHQVLNPWFGANVIPKNYHTPPYLIATPEVMNHRLTAADRFLILATDGLWDFLTPEKAVNLVGDFLLMSDKVGSFQPKSTEMSLQEIHQTLARRKAALWPLDGNVATHLIRYALGGVHNRFDHIRLANTLSLPDNVVRQYRDDITVTVVFFS